MKNKNENVEVIEEAAAHHARVASGEMSAQDWAELENWLEENEYESIQQMQGSMSQKAIADPSAFERANYMKVLGSY